MAILNMQLKEKEEQYITLIKEQWPYINTKADAVREGLKCLATGERPPVTPSVDKGWVTLEEAARILTENSENRHTVTKDHAYKIAKAGHIRTIEVPGRGRGGIQFRYNTADCAAYRTKMTRSPFYQTKCEEVVTE